MCGGIHRISLRLSDCSNVSAMLYRWSDQSFASRQHKPTFAWVAVVTTLVSVTMWLRFTTWKHEIFQRADDISAWLSTDGCFLCGFCSAALIPWLWMLCVALRETKDTLKSDMSGQSDQICCPDFLDFRIQSGFGLAVWTWTHMWLTGLCRKRGKGRMALSTVHNSSKVPFNSRQSHLLSNKSCLDLLGPDFYLDHILKQIPAD